MRQMGFFDNLKSSLAETGQDLSQKAKDTTEIFRLTNLNKTKEKEIEKVIYQIGSTYYANYRDECMEKIHNRRFIPSGCRGVLSESTAMLTEAVLPRRQHSRCFSFCLPAPLPPLLN